MKSQQLQKDLEAFQKQLKQALPTIINRVTKDIGQMLYFEKLFKDLKPNSVQELYFQSLLRLDPHIARQQPQLDEPIQNINELIHLYFEQQAEKLQEMVLLEKELKMMRELEELQVSQESTQIQNSLIELEQSKGMDVEKQNMEEVCNTIKRKYWRQAQSPSCDQCFCGNQLHYKQIVKCQLCEKHFHINCLDKSYDERYVKHFTCPRCTLYHMDQFCEVISVIIEPFSFKKTGLTSTKTVKFKSDTNMIDVRCIRMDCPLSAEEITWPDLGELHINNKKVAEFIPLAQQSCQHKRKDEKLIFSIPQNEECSLMMKETIPGMEQKRKYRIQGEQLHYVAGYKTKQYSGKQLIEKIITSSENWMSVEQAQDFIILQMNYISSTGIKQIKQTISLLCCLCSTLMVTPVRGIYCNHIQCFSLENYLLMLEMSNPRKWRCPICKAKLFKLQIDALQYTILQTIRQYNLQEKYSEISFDHMGNILDDLIQKFIDFNNLPEHAKTSRNRILQLETLSNQRREFDNEMEESEQLNNRPLNPNSIVIIYYQIIMLILILIPFTFSLSSDCQYAEAIIQMFVWNQYMHNLKTSDVSIKTQQMH
ncbi:unnamed protein product (macronuclear) [Paramecium tetraurelia]|uniref:SP-RING-type domain-containing protein n=1 Tax=Paramecium tetraurelia TaxID=5888 RepID=A0CUV2_PARTE|nr:uncharacterized protein GSPATT00039024001 [Paramecium tetraurelia]CAK74569.1 unnamed protein product [Paramecium tetraurelia]|eukprot:XP_001441966.1 hypothetical protein (macronuclear) [Paramecium tetraurelia strain d4-2]